MQELRRVDEGSEIARARLSGLLNYFAKSDSFVQLLVVVMIQKRSLVHILSLREVT